MKILHVIASVDPMWGGPIEGVFRFAEAWKKLGYVREIVSLDSPDDPCVSACPVNVHAVGIRGQYLCKWRNTIPWMRYRYTPHLVPWLRQNVRNYDAVIVNGLWNYVSFGTWRSIVGGRVPYFVYAHGMLDPWFNTAYPLKRVIKQIVWWIEEKRVLRDAKAVLFTSEEERTLARKAFWPYRANEEVVGYGTKYPSGDPQIEIETFRGVLPALGGRRFLLFLSRIHPKKGCDLLIRAFARVARAYPDIDLVIAGPDQVGLSRELKGLAHQLGIDKRIHWPGMLFGDAKWGAFRTCDAFVLPSHSENFGIAIVEALGCAKPVLITDKVNIWREVLESCAGLVCTDTDDSVHDMLVRFLRLPEQEILALGENARQCFLNKFEIDRAADRLLAVLTRYVKVHAGTQR